MYKLVLLRHGESLWNKENRFTGWVDVDLSDTGKKEAKAAGELLKKEGYNFDFAYTSLLKRAIKTLFTVQDELDLLWIPVVKSWRLNERHYGALQGLNKAETAKKYGEKQVHIWRRSYDIPPDPLASDDPRHPSHDLRYKDVPKKEMPSTEALKNCLERVLPFWEKEIAPSILSGKKVLVAAHGNSIRALVKHLDGISDDAITELNIPTGIPLVYELDKKLKPIKHYYLGDAHAAEVKAKAVAAQTKG